MERCPDKLKQLAEKTGIAKDVWNRGLDRMFQALEKKEDVMIASPMPPKYEESQDPSESISKEQSEIKKLRLYRKNVRREVRRLLKSSDLNRVEAQRNQLRAMYYRAVIKEYEMHLSSLPRWKRWILGDICHKQIRKSVQDELARYSDHADRLHAWFEAHKE